MNPFLLSLGDIVGLPNSFLAPLFTNISNKHGPLDTLNSLNFVFSSASQDR